MKAFRMLDLFTGIGGFHLAAVDVFGEELETIAFCENNIEKIYTLENLYPGIEIHPDIKTLPVYEDIDILTAGFPCQDASLANKERAGLSGKQTGLFYHVENYIDLTRPNWFILENVPGLLNCNRGKDFLYIIDTLQKFGYCVCWRVLDGRYFGVSQRRRRVFIVGSYRNTGSVKVLFNQQSNRRDSETPQGERESGVCNTITTNEGRRGDVSNETLITGTICRNTKGNEQFPGNLVAATIVKKGAGAYRYATGDYVAETNGNGNGKVNGISGRVLNKIRMFFGDAIVPEIARQIFTNIKEVDKEL